VAPTQEEANIKQATAQAAHTSAFAISELLRCGYTSESVIEAVHAADMSLLKKD